MSNTTIGVTEDKIFYKEQSGTFQIEYFRYGNTLPGIYSITNQENGKIYIGQTQNYRDRAANHRRDFRKSIHRNRFLMRAYKRGDKFIMQLIESCDVNQLDEREEFWVKFLGTMDKKKGYNLTIGGKSPRGYKHTEEWKRKASIRGKEIMKTLERDMSSTYKSVLCYSLQNGKFLSEHESIADAARKNNVPIPSVSAALNNRAVAPKGFIFLYKSNNEYPLETDNSFYLIKINKWANNGALVYPVVQSTEEGEFIKKWAITKELIEYLGVTQHTLCQRMYRGNGSFILGSFKYTRECPKHA